VFGLTGSIASGKSTFGRALVARGAELVDADRLGHRLLWKGRPGYRRVLGEFGPAILGPRGGIDRSRLGRLVFGDPDARRRLEAILHPAILDAARRRIVEIASAGWCIVVFEAALLVESGFDALMDDTVVVIASPGLQLDRLIRQRGMSAGEARRRIRAQLDGRRKAARARWVVRNEAGMPELEAQADRVYAQMLEHPAARSPLRSRPGGVG
jgi:dephospho-CoA kinase